MLSVVAGVSLVYDLSAGVVLLVATDRMASWFGAPVPDPILFAKLNGLFLDRRRPRAISSRCASPRRIAPTCGCSACC